MKRVCKKIFVYILSVILFVCSIFGSYIVAYAEEEEHPVINALTSAAEWADAVVQNIGNWAAYLVCQAGAILDENDYALFLSNLEARGDVTEDIVEVAEDGQSATFDVSEIMSYLQSAFGFVQIQPYDLYSHKGKVPVMYKDDTEPYYEYLRSIGIADPEGAYGDILKSLASSQGVKYPLYSFTYTLDGYNYVMGFNSKSIDELNFYLPSISSSYVYVMDNEMNDFNFRWSYFVGMKVSYSTAGVPYLVSGTTLTSRYDVSKYVQLNHLLSGYDPETLTFKGIGTASWVYQSFRLWTSKSALTNYLSGNSGYLGSRLQQIVDNGNEITVRLDDLQVDWETAYRNIGSQLDDLKEATGSMPTQEQIDSYFDDIQGALDYVSEHIDEIADDVLEVVVKLDGVYEFAKDSHEMLQALYDAYSDGELSSAEVDLSPVTSAVSSLQSALDTYQEEDREQYAALQSELQEISSLLSSGTDQDYSSALDTISSALSDIEILMNDRVLALLEAISSSQEELSGAASDSAELLSQIQQSVSGIGDANLTLSETQETVARIEAILSDMAASDIDTSKLEAALDEVRQAIADAGSSGGQDLDDMKTLLADMQDVLIEIKSGIASQKDYSEALEDINDLLGKIYKVEKFSAAVDVADLLTDFAALLDDGDSSFLDRMGASMSNVVNASQEHFPTSVPWDMILLFTAMDTDAVAPSYEIPFSMPALGVDETVAIDLSGFEQLSKVSRALLSVLFILLLIALTRKMCSGEGEGDG